MTLTPLEEQISAHVDRSIEDTIDLIESAVRIPSATRNLEGVRRVADVYSPVLETLGFSTRWVTMPPEMNRAGHLISERSGTRGKRLLLIGHLDTVLEDSRFERDGDHARGIGVSDMKGGNAVMVAALGALHACGALEETTIGVVLTGDEEDPGKPFETSRAPLIELAQRSDIALAFEAAVGMTATIARRGFTTWRLTIDANGGHSSAIFTPTIGSGAIYEAARFISEIHDQLGGEENLTINPSLTLAGTNVEFDAATKRGSAGGMTNVVPSHAVIEGDLRFLDTDQRQRAEATMCVIAARNLNGTRSSIEFTNGYPSMAPTPGNVALLGELDRVSWDLGFGEVTPIEAIRRGAGDISFAAPFIDGLDGLGTHGQHEHTAEETVDLSTLPMLIKRAAILIHRLTRG